MTSHLSHELHAMVDDAPTVDVIDRALGTARGMRRRRTGAGVVGAVAVAAALAAPFALFGAGRPPAAVGASADETCTVAPPPRAGSTGRTPVGQIIAAHLPSGYPISVAVEEPWCGLSNVYSYNMMADFVPRVSVILVPRADKLREQVIDGVVFTPTNCKQAMNPSIVPAPWPSLGPSAPSGSPGGPSNGVSLSPTPSDSWPSWTPSNSPSDSPSGSPSGSPGTSPSGSPGTSPSGSPGTSPSGSPGTSPSGSPGASPSASILYVVPRAVFCRDATATSPMVYAYDTGLSLAVVAVWADHRAIIADLTPSGPAPNPAGSVTVDRLVALVTDPALLAQIPRR